VVPEAAALPLADLESELPEGISLPGDFRPLAGHYDLANPDDHYAGWPRYIVSQTDNMIMCYVPTQILLMGGGPGPDDVPARHIQVNHFYIDLHEVTNAQFSMHAAMTLAQENSHDGRLPFHQYFIPGHNDHYPVRNVSWFEAMFYARWAGKSLPTEAQWEAAARGDDGRIYPWGNDARSDVTRYLCNSRTGREDYDGYKFTAPVLNYAGGVSPFGAFNMAGNVWEWCADWYDPGRYAYPSAEDPPTGLDRGALPFGDPNYPNPVMKVLHDSRVGPIVGGRRAIRGGSFANPIEQCRVDVRAAAGPGIRRHNVGFRCVLLLPPVSM
jgi:formylglycine-generating enzyme required for sulfatase activity